MIALFSEESGSSQAPVALPEAVSEEDVFEYVVEEVAGYEPTDDVRKGSLLVRVRRWSLVALCTRECCFCDTFSGNDIT